MGLRDDPFGALPTDESGGEFAALQQRAIHAAFTETPPAGARVARLHGFDLLDQPLVGDLPECPGQLLVARSTVSLRRSMAGREVVVLFEGGDVQRPIIIGAIHGQVTDDVVAPGRAVVVEVDSNERHIVSAEREIVMRCGDASITLTRAGKVIIQGTYILSRSTGYNKIKGAAIDIN